MTTLAAKVRVRVRRGWNTKQIADDLHKSPRIIAAIRCQLARQGRVPLNYVRMRRGQPERYKSRALALGLQGLKPSIVAERLGASQKAVSVLFSHERKKGLALPDFRRKEWQP